MIKYISWAKRNETPNFQNSRNNVSMRHFGIQDTYFTVCMNCFHLHLHTSAWVNIMINVPCKLLKSTIFGKFTHYLYIKCWNKSKSCKHSNEQSLTLSHLTTSDNFHNDFQINEEFPLFLNYTYPVGQKGALSYLVLSLYLDYASQGIEKDHGRNT